MQQLLMPHQTSQIGSTGTGMTAAVYVHCCAALAGRRPQKTSADLSCRMDSSFWMSSVLSSCSCSRLSFLHAVSSREPAAHRLNLTQATPDRAKPEQALSLTFMCMKSAHGVKRPGLQVAYSCPACT